MSLATNLLTILIGVNLMVFLFGQPENNAPILSIIKAIFLMATGTPNWTYIIFTIGKNLWMFGTLVGIIIGVSYLTGGTPLTGGGYASILTLEVLGIAIVSSLTLMPQFSTFGFPAMVEYTLDIIFGGWITVMIVSLFHE